MEKTLSTAVLTPFPAERKAEADRLLAQAYAASDRKIIVLDDDPTGVQTVHDVSVYTDWSPESLREGFAETSKLFFILTNSRGFTVEETTRAHREIIHNVIQASRESGRAFLILSRGDSTLRGHYPLETQLLREGLEAELGITVDGEILCPYFREGGRFTLGDTHYVRYGETLVPAAQTEFALDATFGYAHSDLKEYIAEKTGGAYPAKDVVSIPLEALRAMEIDRVEALLMGVHGYGKVIVNACDDTDVKVFCIALYRALAKGKHFCYRTAAAFVKALGNISDRPLLTRAEMVTQDAAEGGIVVVGSHTQKTTAQMQELLTLDGVVGLELNSDLVLQPGALDAEAQTVTRQCEALIAQGKTPVVYTRRTLLTVAEDTPEAALVRSVKISGALQSVVGQLRVTPAFIVAKGGITSSDVGTKALRVRRATVLGQIRPGIPVWKTGDGSLFPGKAYVIFPGNVGEVTTLREAVAVLMGVSD